MKIKIEALEVEFDEQILLDAIRLHEERATEADRIEREDGRAYHAALIQMVVPLLQKFLGDSFKVDSFGIEYTTPAATPEAPPSDDPTPYPSAPSKEATHERSQRGIGRDPGYDPPEE